MKGLWVRNQQRTRLILVDHFAATTSGLVLGFQGPNDDCGVVLGDYKSESRALEVINSIQYAARKQFETYNMFKE